MNLVCLVAIILLSHSCLVIVPCSAEPGCRNGAVRFGDKCYMYISNPNMFYMARGICVDNGGELAIIKDAETGDFLKRYHIKMTVFNYWVEGSKDSDASKNAQDPVGRFYLGENDHWRLPDQNENKLCSAIFSDKGLHSSSLDCNKKFLYICENSDFPNICSSSDIFQEKCYSFSRQKMRDFSARDTCTRALGKLAKITSGSQLQFLINRIEQEVWWKTLTDDEVELLRDESFKAWIGVYRNASSGEMMNVDGTIANERIFPQKLKVRSGGCMLLGWMSPQTCEEPFPSICQFNATIDNSNSSIPYSDATPSTMRTANVSSTNIGILSTTSPTLALTPVTFDVPTSRSKITAAIAAVFLALGFGAQLVIFAAVTCHRRRRMEKKQPEELAPPVPPRPDSDYLVPQGNQYLHLVPDSNTGYEPNDGSENIYSYVTDPQSTFAYILNRDNANANCSQQNSLS